jgi:hypothetical protein
MSLCARDRLPRITRSRATCSVRSVASGTINSPSACNGSNDEPIAAKEIYDVIGHEFTLHARCLSEWPMCAGRRMDG